MSELQQKNKTGVNNNKQIPKNPISKWNELATKDMSLWNMRTETSYSEKEMRDDGVWTFEIVQLSGMYKNCSGKASAKNLKIATINAYEILWQAISIKHMEHSLSQVQICRCGDVETNPGPIRIARKFVRIGEGDEKSSFVLQNNFFFWLNNNDFLLDANYVTFLVVSDKIRDELEGRIGTSFIKDESFVGEKITTGTGTQQSLTRSTIYSNHVDYQPSSRIGIRVYKGLLAYLNSNNIFMALDNQSEGHLVMIKNFCFFPRNALAIRFSRQTYSHSSVDQGLYFTARASISNQEMSCSQFAETCALLTTVQMMYLDAGFELEAIIGLFTILFEQNIHEISKDRGFKFSIADVWTNLFNLDHVFVPTYNLEIKAPKDFVRNPSILKTKEQLIRFTQEGFQQLALTTQKKIDFSDDDEQLVSQYESGVLSLFSTKVKVFRFNMETRFLMISTSEIPEPGDFQKAIKFMVEDRFTETNIINTMRRTVKFAKRFCSSETLRLLVSKFVEMRIDAFYQPGLSKAFAKKSNQLVIPDFTNTHEKVQFINDKLVDEKRISQFAQTEYNTWSKILGKPDTTSFFNNTNYILELAEERRSKIKLTAGETDEDYDNHEADEGDSGFLESFADGVYSVFKAPFNFGKNLAKDFSEMSKSLADIAKGKDELIGQFKKVGMPEMVSTIQRIDFSSFQSTFSSVKSLFNAWFTDFASKICSLFGVEYTAKIEATTLFFYYLIWIHTSSKTIKFMLVIDILTQLGLVDFVFKYITKIGKKLFGMFKDSPTGKSEDFAAAIADMDLKTKIHEKENEKERKEKIETPKQQSGQAWLDKLLDIISNGSPLVLATMATTLLVMLGFSPIIGSKESLGNKIASGMRNISFVSLGLLALPKIFENVLKVIDFVQDHVKKVFCKDHKTKIEKQKGITDWLAACQYAPTVTPKLFVRDLDVCLEFMSNYGRMLEIKKDAVHISNLTIAVEFRNRCKIMEELHPTCVSAVRIILGQREIFHVQLFSSNCGIGKTDAAIGSLAILKQTLQDEENKIRQQLGLDVDKNAKHLSDVYPLSETLKHNDMYYGQEFGYIDEIGVFNNPDADTIINTMVLMSGFPCISQQAALTDKGRIFELKCLISNTNNPWNAPKGMNTPQALWRRRNLFEVSIKPQYQKKSGTEITIDDAKIEAAGINRTKGEHLTFTWRDAADQQAKKPEVFQDMEIAEFRTLIAALMRKHIQLEERRLLQRDPMISILRNHYDFLIRDIEEVYGQQISKHCTISEIRERLEGLKPKTYKAKFAREEDAKEVPFNRNIKQRLDDCEILQPHCSKEFDSPTKAMLKLKETTASDKFVYSALHCENGRLYLKPSKTSRLAEKGEVNWDAFEWDQGGPVYTAVPTNHSAVLYWMIRLSTCFNQDDMNKMIAIAKLKTNKFKTIDLWKAELQSIHYSTARAVKSVFNWIKDKVIDRIGEPFLAGVAFAFAAVGMFFSLSMIGQILAPQSATSYGTPYERSRGKKSPGADVPCVQIDEYSVEQSLVKRSSYRVYVCGKDKINRGMMIGLQGSCFLINQHVLGDIEEDTKIYVYNDAVGQYNQKDAIKEYWIRKQHVSKIPNTDCAVIYIKGHRPVRAVLKHFVTEKDLEEQMLNFSFGQYSCVAIRETGKGTQAERFADTPREWFTTDFGTGLKAADFMALPHDRVIKFSTQDDVRAGDSGGICLHDNPKIHNKFIGILIGQRENMKSAYIGVVSQEEIQAAMKKLPDEARIVTVPKEGVKLTNASEYYDVFDYKQELYKSPYQNQGISKSLGFRKSPIHGTFPVDSEPAIQDSRDRRIPEFARHPLKISMNKTGGLHEPAFSVQEENFMKKFLKHSFVKYVRGLSTIRVFDTRHAITGVRSMGSASMNTKTCAGLPYKLEPGVVGKSPFIVFNEVTKTWQIAERVIHDVQSYEDIYNDLRVPHNYKLEFRKKELVPHSKIENPKTRTVATGNFIHQIVYNKCLKDLYTLVKNTWENGFSCPFAIGVDNERHWYLIAQHLKFTDHVLDFDVKAWEEKVCLRLLYMNAEVKTELIREAYLSRKEAVPNIKNILYGLAVDFTDTEVIFEDIMYRKQSGLLSGHPGTFMENSEIHEMIIGLVCFRILKRLYPSWATVDFIHEHVRTIKAADDIQIAISPIARNFLTKNRIIAGYNELGFEVTSADKDSEIRVKKLDESQFLKHGFRRTNDGEYQAIPNLSIIHQLMNWVRDDTKLSMDDQFTTNLENAFRYAFWRGRDEYEEIREKANVALREHRREWIPDFDEMAVLVRSYVRESERIACRDIPLPEQDYVGYVDNIYY